MLVCHFNIKRSTERERSRARGNSSKVLKTVVGFSIELRVREILVLMVDWVGRIWGFHFHSVEDIDLQR